MAVAASFQIHARCANCRKDVSYLLDVPDEDDAPITVDELLESAFLAAQRFSCRQCDSPTGTISSVKKLKLAA